MLKPPPSATIPGVTDTLDFVKNLWGSMNIPGAGLPGMSGMAGMSGPVLSTEELDKRIADMKAVESWLNLNLTMLRGTIQAMEVQRGTLATLKSMGASMAEAMRQSGVSAEKLAAMPFGPFFGQPAQGSAPSASGSASGSAPARPAAGGGSAQPGAGAPAGSAPGADAGAATGMPAAMAWWNMLQEQFTQAVTTAMTPSPAAADGKDADKPAAPQPQAQAPSPPAPDSASPENGNGNGKARGGKPRTDKG